MSNSIINLDAEIFDSTKERFLSFECHLGVSSYMLDGLDKFSYIESKPDADGNKTVVCIDCCEYIGYRYGSEEIEVYDSAGNRIGYRMLDSTENIVMYIPKVSFDVNPHIVINMLNCIPMINVELIDVEDSFKSMFAYKVKINTNNLSGGQRLAIFSLIRATYYHTFKSSENSFYDDFVSMTEHDPTDPKKIWTALTLSCLSELSGWDYYHGFSHKETYKSNYFIIPIDYETSSKYMQKKTSSWFLTRPVRIFNDEDKLKYYEFRRLIHSGYYHKAIIKLKGIKTQFYIADVGDFENCITHGNVYSAIEITEDTITTVNDYGDKVKLDKKKFTKIDFKNIIL